MDLKKLKKDIQEEFNICFSTNKKYWREMPPSRAAIYDTGKRCKDYIVLPFISLNPNIEDIYSEEDILYVLAHELGHHLHYLELQQQGRGEEIGLPFNKKYIEQTAHTFAKTIIGKVPDKFHTYEMKTSITPITSVLPMSLVVYVNGSSTETDLDSLSSSFSTGHSPIREEIICPYYSIEGKADGEKLAEKYKDKMDKIFKDYLRN